MFMNKLLKCLFILLYLAAMGCNALESVSNDSSPEADLEQAKMDLNEGNYQGAINILEPGYNSSNPDPEATRILASAYMGKAGFDLINLIENSDSDSDKPSFDVIASALGLDTTESPDAASAMSKAGAGSARYIQQASIDNFISYLEHAQTYLKSLVDAYNDDDDIVQLGMVSAVHFILEIGIQAADSAGIDNIPINKAAYQATFPSSAPDLSTLLSGMANNIDTGEGVLDSLRTDVTYVDNAVAVLDRRMGSDKDIAVKFNDFMDELLGSSNPADLNGTLVKMYISTFLLGY
jgi:hypothetical protein